MVARALTLAALAGLGACSTRSSGPAQAPVQTLEGFVLTETRNRGATQWILKAREAIMRDSGGADLASPHLEIFKDGKPATDVDSKHGAFDDKTRDMHLRGDVVVVSRDEGSEKTTLRTDALDYIESERKFKTDQPVRIERKGSTMRGRGLIASHDLSEIHVLHQEATFQ